MVNISYFVVKKGIFLQFLAKTNNTKRTFLGFISVI